MADRLPEQFEEHGVTDKQRSLISQLLFEWRKEKLLRRWLDWRERSGRASQLEGAQEQLCEFQYGLRDPLTMKQRLDDLASRAPRDLFQLPVWLAAQGLRGNKDDYYDPANSFVSEVIRVGKGNPITLCTVLILVGQRLGLEYWGCNFPGHFLARFSTPEAATHYVDCFDGGKIYGPQLATELRGELSDRELQGLLQQNVEPEQIVARMLRNLVGTYLKLERRDDANLYTLLLKDLSSRAAGLGSGTALREPRFTPGDLVQHAEKGYRGVVVDYDLYQLHESGGPPQPTYRILVHGSPHVASAWEEQLQADTGGLVAHPFVSVFFSRFENGIYVRNSRPWEAS